MADDKIETEEGYINEAHDSFDDARDDAREEINEDIIDEVRDTRNPQVREVLPDYEPEPLHDRREREHKEQMSDRADQDYERAINKPTLREKIGDAIFQTKKDVGPRIQRQAESVKRGIRNYKANTARDVAVRPRPDPGRPMTRYGGRGKSSRAKVPRGNPVFDRPGQGYNGPRGPVSEPMFNSNFLLGGGQQERRMPGRSRLPSPPATTPAQTFNPDFIFGGLPQIKQQSRPQVQRQQVKRQPQARPFGQDGQAQMFRPPKSGLTFNPGFIFGQQQSKRPANARPTGHRKAGHQKRNGKKHR